MLKALKNAIGTEQALLQLNLLGYQTGDRVPVFQSPPKDMTPEEMLSRNLAFRAKNDRTGEDEIQALNKHGELVITDDGVKFEKQVKSKNFATVETFNDGLAYLTELSQMGYSTYLYINGARYNRDVKRCPALFYECDDCSKDEQWQKVEALKTQGFEPSFVVDSGKSLHVYFVVNGLTVEDFPKYQQRLIQLVNSDPSIHNLARQMRLAGFDHTKFFNSDIVRKPIDIAIESGKTYDVEDFNNFLPVWDAERWDKTSKRTAPTAPAPYIGFDRIPLDKVISKEHRDFLYGVSDGGRNVSGFSLACDLIGSHDWLVQNGYTPLDDPYYLFQVFSGRCNPPIDDRELETIWKSASQGQRSPSLPDEYIQNCVNGFLKVKVAPKVTSSKVASTDKRFKINLSNLCSLPSRRVFQATSTLVTATSLMSVYRELREWEQALALIAPDTKVISSPRKIIDKIADRWQIDDDEIDAAIAELGEIKIKSVPSDDRIDLIGLYRTRIIEGSDTQEEIDKAEKQEYFNMCDRVFAWFRTNLLFNQQIQMWHRYVNGVWKMISDEELKSEVRQILTDIGMSDTWLKGAKVSDDKVNNFAKEIKSAVLIERLDSIKKYKHLINLQDGVLDRKTMTLLPHSREYRFSWQLPYRWEDRKHGAKEIMDWLEWAIEQPDQIKLLLCYLNAIVCGRDDIQKVFQLIGTGGAGKSTFNSLAIALTGNTNVQQSSIELLENNQFETSNLISKKLLTISEIGEYRGSGANLKRASGRDILRNENKNVQARNSGFTFRGQILIQANTEYAPNHGGSSFDRRNICVPFTKVIPTSKKRELIKIDDDGSLSGEFAPCLPALLEMVLALTDKEVTDFMNQTNVFVPSLNDAATNSILNGDTLAQWVEENLVAIEGARTYVGSAKLLGVSRLENGTSVSRKEYEKYLTHLFPNYMQYCLEHGAKDKDSVNMQNFSKKVMDLFLGTLRNSFVKKAVRDKVGCAILGLAIRTPEHANIPTPIKGVLLDVEATYDQMYIETLEGVNISDHSGDFQTLAPSPLSSSVITISPLPFKEEVHNYTNLHPVGVELPPASTETQGKAITRQNLAKGDKVKISIPLDLFNDPDIINALENGDIPPLDKTYTVDEIYMIDGFTYIGFDGRDGRVFEGYVEKVTA
jgi:phage/plasmid-associated DNA primase